MKNFPRIRGDDPPAAAAAFVRMPIFPVFAGMIPPGHLPCQWAYYFPRIRGDDPSQHGGFPEIVGFSPYSRG